MKKIGNIVSKNNLNGFDNLFNVVSDYSLIDDKLPTLIIGYERASELIDGYTILQKEYNNGMLRWTFSRNERRSDYTKDIEDFKEYCIMQSIKNVKYSYIDFTKYGYNKIKKIIEYLKSEDKKLCFVTKNSSFIFIYSERYNIVWGLSLSLCEYIGIDKHKVLDRLRTNRYNQFIKNIGLIGEDIRKKIGENTHYLLPIYLYFGE